METSATRSASTPSIASSYNRISGGTPIISSSGGSGPKLKSKKEAALEREMAEYEAQKAVDELRRKDAEAKNPILRVMREQSEVQQSSVADRWNKTKQGEAQMRNRFSREVGAGQDYQKWRNYQEVQGGTPAGQFLMSQRLAQLGGNVNSPEYRDLSSRARNAALAAPENTLW